MSAASVKVYENRNWDGFFNSPEYVNFANGMKGLTGDQKVYQSPFFGNITGSLFGSGIDAAFEDYQERIQNPGKVSLPGNTAKSTSVPLLLLAAAAAAYVLS
jgi:hypothetical protein